MVPWINLKEQNIFKNIIFTDMNIRAVYSICYNIRAVYSICYNYVSVISYTRVMLDCPLCGVTLHTWPFLIWLHFSLKVTYTRNILLPFIVNVIGKDLDQIAGFTETKIYLVC